MWRAAAAAAAAAALFVAVVALLAACGLRAAGGGAALATLIRRFLGRVGEGVAAARPPAPRGSAAAGWQLRLARAAGPGR